MDDGSAKPPRFHKRIRLDVAAYSTPGQACSLTVAVRDRRPVFADARVAVAAVAVLRQLAASTGVTVYGYCVMPEHVHLVVAPSGECDVITFVGRFKNLSQRAAWSLGVVGVFWQKSFWDHLPRSDELVERVVAYVVENPVRRGLVGEWREYPYAGSLALDL